MLSSLAQVKAFAGIDPTDTSRDIQFRAILAGIDDYVRQKLNRDISLQTYTELYSGDGTPILLVNQRPLMSVISVYLDNGAYWGQGDNAPYSPFGPSTLLMQGVDYAIRLKSSTLGDPVGRIYKIRGSWTAPSRREMGTVSNLPSLGIGNIQVTYMAGYANIPLSLSMAISELVIRKTNSAIFGGAISEGAYEDASVTYLDPEKAATMFGSLDNVLAQFDDVAV